MYYVMMHTCRCVIAVAVHSNAKDAHLLAYGTTFHTVSDVVAGCALRAHECEMTELKTADVIVCLRELASGGGDPRRRAPQARHDAR